MASEADSPWLPESLRPPWPPKSPDLQMAARAPWSAMAARAPSSTVGPGTGAAREASSHVSVAVHITFSPLHYE